MESLSFLLTAVAAVGGGVFLLHLRALLVQVAASTPQAMWWLPAVGPDVSELLAVEAML
jgi:hypothetical protein